MDRNQFTGLILMFALLLLYFTFFAPEPPPEKIAEEEVEQQQQTSSESTTPSQPPVAVSDSLVKAMDSLQYGIFSFARGSEELQIVENEELQITFTNQGGKIKHVVLKNFKDYLGNNLVLFDDKKSTSSIIITHKNKQIDLSELTFKGSKFRSGDTITMSYILSGVGFEIIHTYKIPSQGYEIVHTIDSKNLNSVTSPTDVNYNWVYGVVRAEKNLKDSKLNSNIRYLLSDGEYEETPETDEALIEEVITTPLEWISFKQKFFTTGIIAEQNFKSTYISSIVNPTDTSTVKQFSIQLIIPYPDFLNGYALKYYFGPNNYTTLKGVTNEFVRNLDLGWGPLSIVNKYLIIPIFRLLELFFSNYGIIIIIIVLVIRLILAPLTYKSHIGMAKMRVMKPELDAIKEKHDGDMQKTQQEQMALYQKVGINPLAGCIPLLLQMPILFALFFFFPNAVELRQQSFLWAHDLSTYDDVIRFPFEIPFMGNHLSLFTVLFTASTLLVTYVNSQMTANIQGPIKTLQYIMPLTFFFVLNSYASGLTFYYFVSNIATYGLTIFFRKFVNEEKIRKTLDENKKKNANKKKSNFQTRLEEAMKASQEAQAKRKSKNKK